jgi:hypothetical protein
MVEMDDNLPVILQFIRFPCTSAVIGICCLVCYILNSRGMGYGDVGSRQVFMNMFDM